ncbi:MAG: hypothetical protein Q8Q14_13480 [Gemmatimonadales bacterium]|nr:hypothetical protein [Gemmatimonadales bacterium]
MKRLALIALLVASNLAAQDSQFGIRGLGTPGRWESVRARGTGGAFGPFDPFSPLIDASAADIRRMTASVTGGASWRTAEFAGDEASLRGTRFPALVLIGPITRHLTLAGGFATYLDRSFGTSTRDTIDLRGNPEPVSDEVRSDGGIADVRIALATRIADRLSFGVGLHRLTGSSRVTATRRFDDSTNYRTSIARDEVAYGGWGGSASLLLDVTADVRVAGWVRSDSKLRADIGGRTTAEDDLPFGFGGGVRWRAGTQAAVAAAVAWRSWGGADGPPNAHDTFGWSVGAELGSLISPLRVGVRGGTMPFGVSEQPTEFAIAAGFGKQFSGGRGRLDFGIERLQRKGGGMTERVWTVLLGLTVRP